MNRREFFISSIGSLFISNNVWANNDVSLSILTGRKAPVLNGVNHRLQPEAAKAFEKMQAAALKDGVKLFSVSSYRGFSAQLNIWNNKYEKYKKQGLKGKKIIEKIIEYSAFPGASRHHWGTDLDISDLNVTQPSDPLNPKHFLKDGIYHKMYAWMQKNSESFGFYEVYTNNDDRKGFHFEPWHYSYKNISKDYLDTFRKVDFVKDIKNERIKGVADMDKEFWDTYMREYVLGINPELL